MLLVTTEALYITIRHLVGTKVYLFGRGTKRANESIYNINIIVTSVRRGFANSIINVPWTFLFLNIEGNHPEKGFRHKVDDLDTADD